MTFIFTIGILYLIFKLAGFAFRAAWGITKIVVFVIFFPLVLVGMFLCGLVTLAVPLLLLAVAGIIISSILD